MQPLITLLLLLLPLLLPLSTSATLKPLSTSCLCDSTTNCDLQCCCDPECSTNIQSQLSRYNRCGDDSFGIPLCSNINSTDLHVDDLYSGLRTIYTVIKRLLCVQRVNIVDPTTFYNRSASQAVINAAITTVKGTIDASNLQSANISSLPTFTINGLFYASQSGVCVTTNGIPSNIGTGGMRQCRAYLQTSTISSHPILSLTTLKSSFPQLRTYSMQDPTSIAPTLLTGPTSTTCSTSTACSNVVRFVKIFVVPDSGAVRQDLSYVVVGDVQGVGTGAYVVVKYQYVFLNTDGSFANVSNVGYKIGSPLQLLKRNVTATGTTTNYYRVSNPINLAYRKPSGDCRTLSTQSSDESIVMLRLGRNEFHTCLGSQSFLYNNLKNSFDLIGVMGSSNTVLADFIAIDWPSLTANPDSNNVLLKIYYVKIGSSYDPQYYVLKATAELRSSGFQDKTLFIQYQEVASTTKTYIPPPPKVDAYLPNDFLFPFYVAQ